MSQCAFVLLALIFHRVYEFNTYSLQSGPRRTLSANGFVCRSFYTRCALSPCERYLLTGSSSNAAFIWDLLPSKRNVTQLYSHDGHVSCVAWSQSSNTTVATCSDDLSVRIWSANFSTVNVNPASRYSNVVTQEQNCTLFNTSSASHAVSLDSLANIRRNHPKKLSDYFSPSKNFTCEYLLDKEN